MSSPDPVPCPPHTFCIISSASSTIIFSLEKEIRSVWHSKSHEAIHHCNVRVRRRAYRRKIQSQQKLLSSPFSKNQRHQRLDHGCWHCMCLSAPYSLLVPSHSASLACSVSIHTMHWFAITAPLVLLFPVMRFVTTQGIIQYISFNTLQMNNESSRKKGI